MGKQPVGFPVKSILVAVDGSAQANRAVALGVEIAKKWKPKVHLIHVAEKTIPKEFIDFAHDEQISVTDYYDRVCSQIVTDAADAFLKAGIKNVVTICPSGNPANEIIKAAEDNKVDLILMGTLGKGGFSRALMGSVSSKVCNYAKTTCVTVK